MDTLLWDVQIPVTIYIEIIMIRQRVTCPLGVPFTLSLCYCEEGYLHVVLTPFSNLVMLSTSSFLTILK